MVHSVKVLSRTRTRALTPHLIARAPPPLTLVFTRSCPLSCSPTSTRCGARKQFLGLALTLLFRPTGARNVRGSACFDNDLDTRPGRQGSRTSSKKRPLVDKTAETMSHRLFVCPLTFPLPSSPRTPHSPLSLSHISHLALPIAAANPPPLTTLLSPLNGYVGGQRVVGAHHERVARRGSHLRLHRPQLHGCRVSARAVVASL